MARTPPRIGITIGPQPMSRLALEKRAAARQASNTRPVNALLFGRAVDAAVRDDADWFISDYPAHANPVLLVADQISRLLIPMGDGFSVLLGKFESMEPVEISMALESVHRMLVDDTTDQEEILRAVTLAAELSLNLRQDPDLSDASAGMLLTYAALEAYYYRRATAGAKRQFDRFRDLIRSVTGFADAYINQDAELGNGMTVWEGWQAVRSLRMLFGLDELGVEMKRRRANVLARTLLGADVILRMTETPVEVDAVERGLTELASLARGTDGIDSVRAALDKVVRDQAREAQFDRPTETTAAEEQRPAIDARLEQAFLPAEEHVAPRKREVKSIVEDLTSVVERIEILLDGDDNSLVFEVAPVLFKTLRTIYGELTATHPAVRDAIYVESDAGTRQADREIIALRILVERSATLVARFDGLRAALAAGGLDVGYDTDTSPSQSDGPLDGVDITNTTIVGLEFIDGAVVLEVDLALLSAHDRYTGQGGAPERAKLSFESATDVRWRRINVVPGATSLGRIAEYEQHGDTYRLAGEWGDVEIVGAEVYVEFDRTV